jgi:ribosomal protein L37AE/L43A
MNIIVSKKGYFYKQYKNNKKKRISKTEYLKLKKSKNVSKIQKGGEAIGKGTSACIFKPGMTREKSNGPITVKEGYVSKLLYDTKVQVNNNREYAMGQLIQQIPDHNKFFHPVEKIERFTVDDFQEAYKTNSNLIYRNMATCGDIKNKSVSRISYLIRKADLSVSALLDPDNEFIYTVDILKKILLKTCVACQLLIERGIACFDLKHANIVINESETYLIDFDSKLMPSSWNEFKNIFLKKFHTGGDYIWAPEINKFRSDYDKKNIINNFLGVNNSGKPIKYGLMLIDTDWKKFIEKAMVYQIAKGIFSYEYTVKLFGDELLTDLISRMKKETPTERPTLEDIIAKLDPHSEKAYKFDYAYSIKWIKLKNIPKMTLSQVCFPDIKKRLYYILRELDRVTKVYGGIVDVPPDILYSPIRMAAPLFDKMPTEDKLKGISSEEEPNDKLVNYIYGNIRTLLHTKVRGGVLPEIEKIRELVDLGDYLHGYPLCKEPRPLNTEINTRYKCIYCGYYMCPLCVPLIKNKRNMEGDYTCITCYELLNGTAYSDTSNQMESIYLKHLIGEWETTIGSNKVKFHIKKHTSNALVINQKNNIGRSAYFEIDFIGNVINPRVGFKYYKCKACNMTILAKTFMGNNCKRDLQHKPDCITSMYASHYSNHKSQIPKLYINSVNSVNTTPVQVNLSNNALTITLKDLTKWHKVD